MSSTTSSRAISTAKFLLGQDGAGVYRQVWDAGKKQVISVHRDEADGYDPCCGLNFCALPKRSPSSNIAVADSVGSTFLPPVVLSNTGYASLGKTQDDNSDVDSDDSEQDNGPHAAADTALKLLRRARTSPDLNVTAAPHPRRHITADDDTCRAGPSAGRVYASAPGSPRGSAPRSPRALEPLRHSSPFAAPDNSSPLGRPQAGSRLGSQSGSQHRAVSFATDHPDSSKPRRMQIGRSKSTGGSISGNSLSPRGVTDSSMTGTRVSFPSRGRLHVSAELSGDLASRNSSEPGSPEPACQQVLNSSFGSHNAGALAAHADHGVAFLEIQAEKSDNSVRSRASSVSWARESSDGSSSIWSGGLLNSAGAMMTQSHSADKVIGELLSRRRSGAGSLHQIASESRDPLMQQTASGKSQQQRSPSPKAPALRLPLLRPYGKDGKGTATRGSSSPGMAGSSSATALKAEAPARSGNLGARSAARSHSTAAEEDGFTPYFVNVQSLEQKVLSKAKSDKDSTRYDKVIADL